MSFESSNTGKQQKIPSSFSSPEFTAPGTHEMSILSNDSTMDSIATNVSSSINESKIIKSINSTTRDSGLGDSTIEDTSISTTSKKQNLLIAHTEHFITVSNDSKIPDITLMTKIMNTETSKLRSVEEDIDIKSSDIIKTQDEEKEIITIIKTTKLTTKVEKIKKSKNRKKSKKSKSSQEMNEKTPSLVKSPSQESTSSESNEETNNLYQVNINKSTEELVFKTTPKKQDETEMTETKQSVVEQQVVDLNSTVLDCEDILSNYSNNNPNNPGSPRHVPDSINEIVNVTDVLSDVTHVLVNNTESKVEIPVKIEEKIVKNEPKKKEKKLNIFQRLRSKTRDRKNENKSPNSKRKLDKSEVPSSPSKLLKTEKHFNLEKYELLSQDEKDRIFYMKNECVSLIMENLTANHIPLEKKDLVHDDLKDLVSRSLDLLRHDRIESFDNLSKELIVEFAITNETKLDLNTLDLVFTKGLKKILLDDRILMNLSLDKSHTPCEEVIVFESNEKNFGLSDLQKKEEIQVDEKVEKSAEINLISENLITESKDLNERIEIVQNEMSLGDQIEAKLRDNDKKESDNCGTTPPPTPQNEIQVTLSGNDGSKNVLETQKEPPILFPSDLNPEILSKVEKKAENLDTVVISPSIVQKTPSSNNENKKVKKPKPKSTLSSCFTCAGVLNNKLSDDEDRKPQQKSKKNENFVVSQPTEQREVKQDNIKNAIQTTTLVTHDLDKKPEEIIEEKINVENSQPLIDENHKNESVEKLEEEKFISLDTDTDAANSIQLQEDHVEQQVEIELKQELTEVKIENEKVQTEHIEESQVIKQETTELNVTNSESKIEEIVQEQVTIETSTSSKKSKNKKKKNKKKKNQQKLNDDKQEENDNEDNNEENGENAPQNEVLNTSENNAETEKPTETEIKVEVEPVETEIKVEIDQSETEIKVEPVDTEVKIEPEVPEALTELASEAVKIVETVQIISDTLVHESKLESETIKLETNEVIQEVKIEPSYELDIKQEVKIEPSEILIGSAVPALVQQNDPVVLPDPKTIDNPVTVIVDQAKPIVEVKTKVENNSKKDKKKKSESDEDGSKVSCFSCRGKKASKQAKKSKIVTDKPEVTKNVQPVVTNLKIEAKPIDAALFTGLDAPDKHIEIVKIENHSVSSLDTTKPNINAVEFENINPVNINPSLIGSTSLEAKEEENYVKIETEKEITVEIISSENVQNIPESVPAVVEEIEPIEIKEEPLEIEPEEIKVESLENKQDENLEIKSNESIVETVKPILTEPEVEEVVVNISEPKEEVEEVTTVIKKSDDPVVLPDPNDRVILEIVDANPLVEPQAKKSEIKQEVPKTSSGFLCCGGDGKRKKKGKKSKKTSRIDLPLIPILAPKKLEGNLDVKEKAPNTETVEVVKIESPLENRELARPEKLPPKDWNKGLDREEGAELIRKEPEVSNIKITDEQEKQLTNLTIEIPSGTNLDEIKILKEEVVKINEEITPTILEVQKEPLVVQTSLTIDSPGAIIKIEREPDHAVIPDLTRDRVFETSVTQKQSESVKTEQIDKVKKSKGKKHKKTSKIDLPLIKILDPPKDKVPQKTQEPKTEVKIDPKNVIITQNVAQIVNLSEGLDQPEKKELVEKETKVEVIIPSQVEIKEIDVKLKIDAVVVQQEEVEKSPEINIDITQYTEEEEKEVEKSVEEEKVEKEVPEVKTVEVEIPKIESPEVPPIDLKIPEIIKLDREPDVVVLPELDLSKRVKEISEEKNVVEQKPQVETKKEKKKKKTGVLDMPLVDVFAPKKEVKKGESLIYVDMPVVDLVVPEDKTKQKPSSKKTKAKKSEANSKPVTCFSCKSRKAKSKIETKPEVKKEIEIRIEEVKDEPRIELIVDEPEVKLDIKEVDKAIEILDQNIEAGNLDENLQENKPIIISEVITESILVQGFETITQEKLETQIETSKESENQESEIKVETQKPIETEIKVEVEPVETEIKVEIDQSETEIKVEPVETEVKIEPEVPEALTELASEAVKIVETVQIISDTLVHESKLESETIKLETNEVIQEVKIEPSYELDIKQEVRIEPSEILIGSAVPALVQQNDPVVLPDPKTIDIPVTVIVDQAKPIVEVKTKVENNSKKGKKKKSESDEDGSKVSCFSCRGKKASKQAKKSAVPVVKTQDTLEQKSIEPLPTVDLTPQIRTNNLELFKGLDKPSSLSEIERNIDFNDVTLVHSRITENVHENTEIEHNVSIEEPVKNIEIELPNDLTSALDLPALASPNQIAQVKAEMEQILEPAPVQENIQIEPVILQENLEQIPLPPLEIDITTPPKKPPRGHLDTSVIEDVDVNIGSINVDKNQENIKMNVKEALIKVNSPPEQRQEKPVKKEKKRTKTSIIDLPLIDILVPKENKKNKKVKEPLHSTVSEPVPEINHSVKIDEAKLDSDKNLNIENLPKEILVDPKGTSIELNQPEVEIFIQNDPQQNNEVTSIKNEYTPKKVDTWTTDPLPTVQIGLHKIGDVEPIRIETKITETKNDIHITSPKKQSDTIKQLTNEEKKLLKIKRTEIVEYLKRQSGFKLEQLIETTSQTVSKKELKAREKLADKLYKRSIKLILKTRANQLTYTELSKKLEKVVSAKIGAHEIEKCVNQIRLEFDNDTLFSSFREEKKVQASPLVDEKNEIVVQEEEKILDENQVEKVESRKSSVDSEVVLRYPNLSWREANERARILFYKGRVPSIHYNEKRDSFHVSMLTQIISNGKEKLAEVPVSDDDVKKLLNSCGLYWDGESITLLNKSDEIFKDAQQEAFDILNSLGIQPEIVDVSQHNDTTTTTINTNTTVEQSKVNYIY